MFIVGNIISCLFWGVVIAIVVTAIVLFLVKGLVNKELSLLSWCAALVMLVLLAIQATLMVGAIKAKGMVSDIEDTVGSLMQTARNTSTTASEQLQITDWIDEVEDEYPFIENIVDFDNLSEEDPEEIVEVIGNEVNSYLNWYIVRRILWSLGFLVVGVLLTVKLMERRTSSSIYDYGDENTNYAAGGYDELWDN